MIIAPPFGIIVGASLKQKLQRFQNRVARGLTGASYDTNSSDLLESFSWKNLETRFKLNKVVLVYNILGSGTAPCLGGAFSARSDYNVYNLRGCDMDLSIPKPKKEFLKRSFRENIEECSIFLIFFSSESILWNSLSYEAKCAPTIHAFKRLIEPNL